MSSKKYIYDFKEGNKEMKLILGGKGANLAEMTNLGLNIPQGFTISCEACLDYFNDPDAFIEQLRPGIMEHLKTLEALSNKKFGDLRDPLLLSVRSGAPMSMPGMMDTVLNLGLNDDAVEGIVKLTDNQRFAFDAYRRFIQMFGDVVMGLE